MDREACPGGERAVGDNLYSEPVTLATVLDTELIEGDGRKPPHGEPEGPSAKLPGEGELIGAAVQRPFGETQALGSLLYREQPVGGRPVQPSLPT